ncbi:hypothetical protein PHLCEN_2v13477 [Hermanssonia centrifuga]|uniref:Cytosolic endo-beta-N-acetylglucosaminidase TIM barrel domain-containing protein n=1 Tax=Hermanssonia centrifuga TaxID=98765 RepID=A0A2R6NE58_9APHY|nr:hypothetical protein PHLCEN_2v13477 [Hermanssonia centrifuga]
MPLYGKDHTAAVTDDNPYFETLAALDAWADKNPHKQTVLEYRPRSTGTPSKSPGKLLSTLRIFEGSGEPDCLRLLVGRLPQAQTGPARSAPNAPLPVSPYYARLLANVAHLRGFDGYLLNVECPLRGGIEQTRALSAWITLLEKELKRIVGDHAQVVWYDSVILDGQLRWQDRLNSLNLPFFIPSSSFFTNYTWPPENPSRTAQYFRALNPSHLTCPSPKVLSDIFVGIDVWGRGQHGGGGLACYKSLEHIHPEGLSTALFGHAWTWETMEEKPGFTWEKWWDHERTLWVGPSDPSAVANVAVPAWPEKQKPCTTGHGGFKPVGAFFDVLPPPNPAQLTFYTSFSPGVGRAWFVNGGKVLQTENGWTDVDKNCSLGNLLWPSPTLTWEDTDRADPVPKATSIVCMDDAWIGGSSLKLSLKVAGSDAEDAYFRCFWIPFQSLSLTPKKAYTVTLVFKTSSSHTVDFDLGLSAKRLDGSPSSGYDNIEITPLNHLSGDLSGGWTKLSIDIVVPSDLHTSTDALVATGLVIGFATEDPTVPLDLTLLLGSLTVYPSLPSTYTSTPHPKLLWANFEKTKTPAPPSGRVHIMSMPRSSNTKKLVGDLIWGIGEHIDAATAIAIAGPDDPNPAWTFAPTSPVLMYFNVYVLAHGNVGADALKPEDAIFVGTTGLKGREERFVVDPAGLPPNVQSPGTRTVRFYVQGVTERGDVLPWEDCVFVDVAM